MRKCSVILAAFLLMAACGCGKTSATSSWLKFHANAIKKQSVESGPFGGWSYLHWESENSGTFDLPSAKKYAESDHWKFISQETLPADAIGKWKSLDGHAFFPLGYHGFAPDVNDSVYERFPRWISGDVTLLKFDTGWKTALGGIERPAYAYILITTDGKKMALYHLWGE